MGVLFLREPKTKCIATAALNNTKKHVVDEQDICGMVSAIMNLALLSVDVLHIDVNYAANLKDFQVKVFDKNTDYMGPYRQKFGRAVYLDSNIACDQLKALEDKLIELIAEARDVAEVTA